ncbi:hypothetical protein EYF80_056302 [Liparis tanakae]|uniref:Uncharacterized protein n=1 Tax=Liparis tanakae TaxID=230148 RepID=A0A4Z2EX79_9TELE|nr:hypothetical protein EYF80_056302 [Liparis tanakae]
MNIRWWVPGAPSPRCDSSFTFCSSGEGRNVPVSETQPLLTAPCSPGRRAAGRRATFLLPPAAGGAIRVTAPLERNVYQADVEEEEEEEEDLHHRGLESHVHEYRGVMDAERQLPRGANGGVFRLTGALARIQFAAGGGVTDAPTGPRGAPEGQLISG